MYKKTFKAIDQKACLISDLSSTLLETKRIITNQKDSVQCASKSLLLLFGHYARMLNTETLHDGIKYLANQRRARAL